MAKFSYNFTFHNFFVMSKSLCHWISLVLSFTVSGLEKGPKNQKKPLWRGLKNEKKCAQFASKTELVWN